jgi:peptidyl-prolyl cis-trans isomerase C
MRTIVTWAILIGVCVGIPLAVQAQPSPVVMTVNDQPVYSWELRLVIPQVQSDLAARGAQQDRGLVIRTATRRVVEARLLAQEARRRNLEVDSGRVDAAMMQIENQSGGAAGLDAALAGLGATSEQLRANVAESELVKLFISTQIVPQVTVTPEEVSALYNENPDLFERPDMIRARHILIRITQGAKQVEKDSAKARATAARERVVAGEDFAAVATEVSEGPNASQGGDLGFFARDSMVPALANAAFALDIGEISDVIETQFGFHVVRLEEKRASSKIPFEEAKGPAEQLLRENKSGQLVSELLAKLAESATVVSVAQPGETPENRSESDVG